jgi:nucleoside 2-deoxyribosyltransferase
MHIYCAGPLFNESERTEMQAIATVLEAAGHSTFLPHRDGLEFARLKPELEKLGASPQRADAIVNRAIFSLDTFQLLNCCDAVVANLNGRVPDEGTVVEATLAWHARKPLVLFKADARSLLDGSDNPMVTGLGGFEMVGELHSLPQAILRRRERLNKDYPANILSLGESIVNLRRESKSVPVLAKLLLEQIKL